MIWTLRGTPTVGGTSLFVKHLDWQSVPVDKASSTCYSRVEHLNQQEGTLMRDQHEEDWFAISVLTQTERRVMEFFAEGYTRDEIASSLGLSPRTIGTSLTVAKEKLYARTLAHAAVRYRSLNRLKA
jgi:DNA-binding CsgD family transcriptional regulator